MEQLTIFVTSIRRKVLQRNQNLVSFKDLLTSEKFFNFFGYSLLIPNEFQTKKFQRFHFYMVLFGMIYFITHSAASFFIFLTDLKNFFVLVENLGYISSWNVLLLKAFWIFFYKWDKIHEAIDILHENFTLDLIEQYIYDTQKYSKKLKLISWMIISTFFGFGLNFLLFIFEHQIYGWITSQDIQWQFAISHYYPFETSNSFAFWSIYTFNVWVVLGAFTILVLTELLYADMLMITSMEFDIIARQISETKSVEQLKILLKIQQKLYQVTKILEDIFSPILWIDNFSVISVLCVAAFEAAVRNLVSRFLLILFKNI